MADSPLGRRGPGSLLGRRDPVECILDVPVITAHKTPLTTWARQPALILFVVLLSLSLGVELDTLRGVESFSFAEGAVSYDFNVYQVPTKQLHSVAIAVSRSGHTGDPSDCFFHCHPRSYKYASRAVLSRMQLTLYATRGTPVGASCFVQVISVS